MGQKVIFQSALTDVKIWAAGQTQSPEQIGSIRMENNAVYKYVAFSGTTAVAVGDVQCYLAYASDGAEVIVDGGNTAFGAGVAMAALATGTKATNATYYATGWIQIKGLATCSGTPAGSPTIGQALTTASASAGNTTVVATDPAQHCAICYDATAKKIICDFPY